MINVVFLSGVTPGPACVIPEDKKIFRVTGTEEPPVDGAEAAQDPAAASEAAPLPVPHMYSA